MTTLSEVEAAVENLPAGEKEVLLRHLATQLSKRVVAARDLPLVPATGRPITQQDIDDALNLL